MIASRAYFQLWRPRSSTGRRGKGRREPARGGVGPGGRGGAVCGGGAVGGGLRPSSAAGGTALRWQQSEAERERCGR